MMTEIKIGKVLVGIPYHPAKDYCLEQCFEAAKHLTYENKEVVLRFDPSEYGSENAVKRQREFFRNLCLDNDFEWLYFMGVDTIPPAGVLEELIGMAQYNSVKIIGGVYWGRHNASNGSPEGAVAWIHELSQEEQSAAFKQPDRRLRVDGMGMDCVLIHRDVLRKISFLSWQQNDDDYPFYDKARELGFEILIDTNVQCKHYFNEKSYTQLGVVVDKLSDN